MADLAGFQWPALCTYITHINYPIIAINCLAVYLLLEQIIICRLAYRVDLIMGFDHIDLSLYGCNLLINCEKFIQLVHLSIGSHLLRRLCSNLCFCSFTAITIINNNNKYNILKVNMWRYCKFFNNNEHLREISLYIVAPLEIQCKESGK